MNEERKVTAKLHGPRPGLHQDIALAESAGFSWHLRHFNISFQVEWRATRRCSRCAQFLCGSCRRTSCRTKGSALHPRVAQVEQSNNARASSFGWLAKFLGRLHARVKFRSCSDVSSSVQRQRRTLPGKLVVFQRKPRRKRATQSKCCEDWQVWVLLEVRILHRTTGERACGTVSQSRARPGRSIAEAQGWQNPKDGRWLAEPTWHAVGRADVVQVTATEAGWDWRGVVDELECNGLGVDWSQARHEAHVSLQCSNVRNFVGPLRSLMRDFSSERYHEKGADGTARPANIPPPGQEDRLRGARIVGVSLSRTNIRSVAPVHRRGPPPHCAFGLFWGHVVRAPCTRLSATFLSTKDCSSIFEVARRSLSAGRASISASSWDAAADSGARYIRFFGSFCRSLLRSCSCWARKHSLISSVLLFNSATTRKS